MINVAIVSTGSELVYGSVHESNAYFLSGRFFPTRFNVIMHLTVGDRMEHLEYAVREAAKKADVVILTGGLGPTDDDYTLEVLKKIYLFSTVVYAPGRDRMEMFFKSIGRSLMKNDIKQVTVPENGVIFDNDAGLAAGYAVKSGGKTIIAMPGVPAEMEPMFENKVLPFLMKEYKIDKRKSVIIRTILMREAQVNDLIGQMDIDFNDIEWGITTVWGMNTVTFVGKVDNEPPAEKILKEAERLFGGKMLSSGGQTLEEEVVNLLRLKKMTLSVAESCTGGLIQKRITDIPGASDVFPGGVVTYSNLVKTDLIFVSPETLSRFGAVSEETAGEMAAGVRKRFNSGIGISVTGIAGPSGGTPDKPVGTVCMGFAVPDCVETVKTEIRSSSRDRIRYFSSQYALDFVRMYLNRI